MSVANGFVRGQRRQKIAGLLRHLEMVMRDDSKAADFNEANPGSEKWRFTDDGGIAEAIDVIQTQCQWALFGSV